MKKSILMLLAAVVLFAVSSCNEDDEQGPDKRKFLIESNWEMSGITSDIEDFNADDFTEYDLAQAAFILDFMDDGNYSVIVNASMMGMSISTEIQAGTWSLSDDYKTLNVDNDDITVKELTQTDLKLSGAFSLFGTDELDSEEIGDLTYVFYAIVDEEE